MDQFTPQELNRGGIQLEPHYYNDTIQYGVIIKENVNPNTLIDTFHWIWRPHNDLNVINQYFYDDDNSILLERFFFFRDHSRTANSLYGNAS